MTEQEISPRKILERIFTRWWLLVLCGLLGGLAGWSFHFLHPPVYQAVAGMTSSIDFQQWQLTQIEEDRSFESAYALAVSSGVLDGVARQAEARGMHLPQYPSNLFLERKGTNWEFTVRDEDPQQAAELANLWVQTAYSALTQAQAHALKADQLHAEIGAFQACLPASAQTPVPTPALPPVQTPTPSQPVGCGNYTLPVIQNSVADLSGQYVTEANASGGVLASMSFQVADPAVAPTKPVLYDRARLTLAGCCIGLVISLWLAGSPLGTKRDGKS